MPSASPRDATTLQVWEAESSLQVWEAESMILRGRRVLIVDDNDTNRRILALQSVGWGLEFSAVGSGAEALALLEAGERYDVAILDMLMPGMDGIELARAMRRYAPALPLIMLSSIAQRATVVGTQPGELAELFAAVLTKPVKPSLLLETLGRVCRGSVGGVSTASRPAAAPAHAPWAPLRVLLAEDNAVNQKVGLRMLERLGYRADVAANGLEVLHALARQPYDVVLMDVQMPEMDGLAASREIRARYGEGSRPRIIAMTGNALEGDRERCLAAGMDGYIAKPVRLDELAAALEGCVPRRPAAAGANTPPPTPGG